MATGERPVSNDSLRFLVSVYCKKKTCSIRPKKKKKSQCRGVDYMYVLGFGFVKRKATPLRNPAHKCQLLKPRFSKEEPIKRL